ncbi:hypothetical protein AR158_c295L [Paramecium bursaria Chlorella virus AR158]|uniref:hypothetical protein n=1 Tax=Paramecium bursaria Chlorella virus AR158 TaxID=380598 RepID=UPI00015AA8F3|nr:hypothetical protein AR158_c295L [Paramecium bursaria Chlorella virus AR158]ABU43840.1 hypothetical protein AR158_c295L [Paramecium bursaria Chlorella virus AR158]
MAQADTKSLIFIFLKSRGFLSGPRISTTPDEYSFPSSPDILYLPLWEISVNVPVMPEFRVQVYPFFICLQMSGRDKMSIHLFRRLL